MDLPLAPWEAVLGTKVKLPTPAGPVTLTVHPGTRAGQHLRLAGRGLKRPGGPAGDLYSIVQIVVPSVIDEFQAGVQPGCNFPAPFRRRHSIVPAPDNKHWQLP